MQAFVQPAFRLEGVRTAAIFGAGRYGRVAAELADRCGWQVQYIVDNNKAAWGTRMQGFDIRAPEALLQDRVDLILVASHAHRDAIAEQLDAMDLMFGRDYVWFLAPIQIGSVQMQVTI